MTTSIRPSGGPATAEALKLIVRGHVQGIGFRPHAVRLASELGLTGCVRNTADGVEIIVEGPRPNLPAFAHRLLKDLPAGGRVESVQSQVILATGRQGFMVAPSSGTGSPRARLPVDRAVCDECRREVIDASNRRSGYEFTACFACGPRFSVIESMPYDREATSLRHFPLCDRCQSEYESVTDRRFHAEAIACADCGPSITRRPPGTVPLQAARDDLCAGRIVAIKGVGGYQLLVRADDASAVARLRSRKHRPTKPFAVMVNGVAAAIDLASFSALELGALTAAQNPIVIVNRRPDSVLARGVAPNVNTVGLFLPSTPLHVLLLRGLDFPVVATSGNGTEEPPAIGEAEAHARLTGIADSFIDHNRPIVRRLDDAVVRVIAGRPTLFRLGRGFSPAPLPVLERFTSEPIVATGAHLNVAPALHSGVQALLAQHLGDMSDPASRDGFESCIRDFERLLDFRLRSVATDLHPDYFTTRWAEAQGVPITRVQHHHAHAAAVQLEHDLLQQQVIAVTWDGTGFGVDGTLWGGEFLSTAPDGSFHRFASLRPIPLIGGEAAVRRPARIAFAMLVEVLGEALWRESHWLDRLGVALTEATAWATVLGAGSNVAWSSGIGRLFDGAAALVLGVGAVSYEGEVAVRLEAAAREDVDGAYPLPDSSWNGPGDSSIPRGDWRPLIAGILADLQAEVDTGVIAARFHNTLAQWAAAVIARQPRLPVVLGGGCFQNRRLTEHMLTLIDSPTYIASAIPPGDGGIAAGQLAVALQRRSGCVPCA